MRNCPENCMCCLKENIDVVEFEQDDFSGATAGDR